MINEAKRIESVADELAELNRKFYDKLLLSDEFYNQLMHSGFAYRQCFLVSIFPDSANTYYGQLIKQDGDVVEFDIDLDNAKYSSWENITVSFRELYEKNRSTKPWLREVVAYDLFSKLSK
ncbi:hypothetical protein [Vibrio neptunius]|uniref:hypothetical protein n=1 Tax=Vibrio neptunius TaxID=170651 RepID=UPI003CE448FB